MRIVVDSSDVPVKVIFYGSIKAIDEPVRDAIELVRKIRNDLHEVSILYGRQGLDVALASCVDNDRTLPFIVYNDGELLFSPLNDGTGLRFCMSFKPLCLLFQITEWAIGLL